MSKLPPEILRALRNDERGEPDPARLARLASSIEGAAAPLLAARRRTEPPGWWELPASWAATLIPVSLVLAMASLLVLWRVAPPRPSERLVAQAPVDQALNELVSTPPR
jgi:hypothetical protein